MVRVVAVRASMFFKQINGLCIKRDEIKTPTKKVSPLCLVIKHGLLGQIFFMIFSFGEAFN
jgi:hypothetical protein